MIEKIANDVSNQLNATPSRDFDGMVGLEAHLREMESLLDLDYVGVQMVGISGPEALVRVPLPELYIVDSLIGFSLLVLRTTYGKASPLGLMSMV